VWTECRIVDVKLVVCIVTTVNHVVKSSFRSAVALLLANPSQHRPRDAHTVSPLLRP